MEHIVLKNITYQQNMCVPNPKACYVQRNFRDGMGAIIKTTADKKYENDVIINDINYIAKEFNIGDYVRSVPANP